MRGRLAEKLCAALAAQLEGESVRQPEGSSPIWNAFMGLSRARSCGPSGPNPISYPEIEAWSRLMRVPLDPHHVDAIVALDEVWMSKAYRRSSAPEGVKVLPQVSSQKLTASTLDLALG
ncbi:hypothetical protein [Salipiger sp. PrR003]|uniref:phage tail assembly chaperone n=1 Tax=Salipiger sp. PrR003 TaxID=2706776 RepID=UPI0013D8FEAA|nr:hypothetical protein [Salipiger sp. PrR003]NDV52158.1 hypothetical protein [Salipiger sp. PrR003]NDV52184.1 hypothetical protein [Salipiger sp. PrR003]